MDKLIVGDDDCRINEVVMAVFTLQCAAVFVGDWRNLAMALATPAIRIKTFEQDLILNKRTYKDILFELLLDWRCRIGDNATLSSLMDCFEKQCGWKAIADHLWQTFKTKIPNEMAWCEVDYRTKLKVMECKVELVGVVTSLSDMLSRFEEKEREYCLNAGMNGSLIVELLTTNITSLTNRITFPTPNCYIPRSFSIKCIVNPKVFSIDSSDIFAITNTQQLELNTFLVREGIKEISKETSNRILFLKGKSDLQNILGRAGNSSVHVLRYNEQKIYWIQSYGSDGLNGEYIEENQYKIDEKQFRAETDWSPLNEPICISASMGMGKSLLLQTLYQDHVSNNPNGLVFFTKFYELFCDKNSGSEFHKNDVVTLIATIFSKNEIGRQVLLKLFTTHAVELFIDGFEDVQQEQIPLVMGFLKKLRSITNIQIFVSIRENMQPYFAEILKVPCYVLTSFKVQDQLLLLETIWTQNDEYLVRGRVSWLASKLVSLLHSQAISEDFDILAIPIHCVILANMYKDYAIKLGNPEAKQNDEFQIRLSPCGLYLNIFNNLLENVKSDILPLVRAMHFEAAVNQVLPSFSNVLSKLFIWKQDAYKSCRNDALKIGILSSNSDNTKLFVPQNYAELLVVQLIKYLINYNGSKSRKYASQGLNLLLAGCLKLTFYDGGRHINEIDLSLTEICSNLKTCSTLKNLESDWEPIFQQMMLTVDDKHWIKRSQNYCIEAKSTENELVGLYSLLYVWAEKRNSSKRLSDLVSFFEAANLEELVGCLKSKYYKVSFENFAFLRILKPLTEDTKIRTKFYEALKSVPLDKLCLSAHQLVDLLSCCTSYNHEGLFKFISSYILIPKNLSIFKAQTLNFSFLVINASLNSSLNLLTECLNFVEKVLEKSLSELEYDAGYFMEYDAGYFMEYDAGYFMEYDAGYFMENDFTPLHVACIRGDFAIFSYLSELFADCMSEMKILLHCCAYKSMDNADEIISQKIQIATYLTEKYPDCIDRRASECFFTPMLVPRVHLKLLKLLISKGANPMSIDLNGNTVAHAAAKYLEADNFHDFVKFLHDNGLERLFRLRNIKKSTPLQVALEHIQIMPETVELLHSLTNTDFNDKDWQGNNELFIAISGFQNILVIKKIVELGGNPMKLRENKQPVIHWSCIHGHYEALEYFLGLNCDINARDDIFRTPLHVTVTLCRKHIEKILKILVSRYLCY